MIFSDTIIGPATAVGEGGVAILRISGSSAILFLNQFFKSSRGIAFFENRKLYHGHIIGPGGGTLDEVLAVRMQGPHTYTGEDVVEVHCHGGSFVLRTILDLFIQAGVRLARPGEFTLRAFLNGRIDLTQAEGVMDLIHAQSEGSMRLAMQQMGGRLYQLISGFRAELMELLVLVETLVDFPDEDIPLPDRGMLLSKGTNLQAQMEHLLRTFDSGRVLREGISVVILGKPNVGKSSLLNVLIGEERSIVTPIPGTTRDTIEEKLIIEGIPLRMIDTAGLRDTADLVESKGVERAKAKIVSAELVLLVIDGSKPVTDEDVQVFHLCQGKNIILVVNKSDLSLLPLDPQFDALPTVYVSAHNGDGLANLGIKIRETFGVHPGGEASQSFLLSDRRHREALAVGTRGLSHFVGALQADAFPELLAVDLREALNALGEITGETTPEDILNNIFSRFCIGK